MVRGKITAEVVGYVHKDNSSLWQWPPQESCLYTMGASQSVPVPLTNVWVCTGCNSTLLTAAQAEPQCLQHLSAAITFIAHLLPRTKLVPDKLSLWARDCRRIEADACLPTSRYWGGLLACPWEEWGSGMQLQALPHLSQDLLCRLWLVVLFS